jgi:redox-sensitive bicupin YhaK (pirin superfamily)
LGYDDYSSLRNAVSSKKSREILQVWIREKNFNPHIGHHADNLFGQDWERMRIIEGRCQGIAFRVRRFLKTAAVPDMVH